MPSHRAAVALALALAAALLASTPAGAAVVINEIMYNSIEADDVEYVELYNTGPASVNLANWYLIDSDPLHPKCFLSGTLDPGEYLVVAGFISRFTSKYPGVGNLNPNQFDNTDPALGWALGNGGDRVRVFDNIGALVDFVEYDDLAPWPTAANGTGPSLELIHPSLDNTLASSWAASTNGAPHGTPGVQNTVYTNDQAPIIESLKRDKPLPTSTDTVTVTARVTDDGGPVDVDLYVDKGSGFVPQAMFDDGTHGDGLSGDQTFGARITPAANGLRVRYYVWASDNLPQSSVEPPGAPAAYHAYTVGHTLPALRINEILASNLNGARDEANEVEDWIEIRNRSARPVDLGGMFLSTDLAQPQMWQLPAMTLQPGDFVLFWADNDEGQGPLHTNFKLTANREDVVLFETIDHGNVPIHVLTYGLQRTDVSFGYRPDDADAPEYLSNPSPDASNNASALYSSIVINEFLTTSLSTLVDDWIELYNRGTSTVNIGGWHLTDERDFPTKYTFPAGTSLAPGTRLVVDENQLGFSLTSTGLEVILLSHSDGVTGQDYFDFGPQTDDVSQGRFEDGTPNWHFFSPHSQNAPNTCGAGTPSLGTVVNLRFQNKTTFSWSALAGAETYDVVKGSLNSLRSSGGNFTSSSISCLENGSPDLEARDGTNPASGSGLFYLARGANDSCGWGTWDEGGDQPAGRDAEVEAASGACP